MNGDATIQTARIVLGCVGATPVRARKAEALIAGKKLTPELAQEAGSIASQECSPTSDLRGSEQYKRAIVKHAGEARGGESLAQSSATTSDVKSIRHAMKKTISLKVNGSERSVDVEPRTTLLDLVREQFGLTGAKLGCDIQVCGACTLLLDGKPVSACSVLAVDADGCAI